MTPVVNFLFNGCKSRQNAGHSRRASGLSIVVVIWLSLAVIVCSARARPTPIQPLIDNNSVLAQRHSNDRVLLVKRAPVPAPEMLMEMGAPVDFYEVVKRKAALTRRMEAFEMKHTNSHALHPAEAKEASHPATHLHEPALHDTHPILNHPVIQTLDKKRKLDHASLQQSHQEVAKAQAQRDAILAYKPERKSAKGKRVTELTMSNISLGKATVVKQYKKMKAAHSDSQFQKVVNQVSTNRQGVVAAAAAA